MGQGSQYVDGSRLPERQRFPEVRHLIPCSLIVLAAFMQRELFRLVFEVLRRFGHMVSGTFSVNLAQAGPTVCLRVYPSALPTERKMQIQNRQVKYLGA